MAALGAALARGRRGLAWYLGGVLGADAYRKYLEHHRQVHPGEEPLTERAYWREAMDRQDRHPQGRCC
nr:YbdD/YjiX family protein [Zafaria cholistanensis]